MKIIIEVDLAEQDEPGYVARFNHALSGLLHESHNHDLGGRYEFTYPASDYNRVAPTLTVVTVTQED